MTLVSNISDLTEAIALEFNQRPVSQESDTEPLNIQDKQFWRKFDGTLMQYSATQGRSIPIVARLGNDTVVDGGNF